MKKIFTLLLSLFAVTAIYAQTPAQEMTNSVFKGSAYVVCGNVKKTVENQELDFDLNASDNNCVDMTISDVAISALGKVITVKKSKVNKFEVTKSGNVYSLKDHSFNLILDNGSGQATVTANITSSEINVGAKTASVKLHIVDLPDAMQKLNMKTIDVTYTLTLSSIVSGINNVTAAGAKANGKFLKDGKVVILNNGKEYNANGQLVK